MSIKGRSIAGDTIVEVLLAIGIAAFGVGVTYATAQRALDQAITAKEHNQALNLIQNQITDLQLRYRKSPSDLFNNNFTATKNHFCLDDSATAVSSGQPWTPYFNDSGLTESSPLQAGGNPYDNNCTNQKNGDGVKYFIDVSTKALSGITANPTVYHVSVRWERLGGGAANQASTYFRINGGQINAFGPGGGSAGGGGSPTIQAGFEVTVMTHPFMNVPRTPGLKVTSIDSSGNSVVLFDHVYTIGEVNSQISSSGNKCHPSLDVIAHRNYSIDPQPYSSYYDIGELCADFPFNFNITPNSQLQFEFYNDETGWDTARPGCQNSDIRNFKQCWKDNNIIIHGSRSVGGNVHFVSYPEGSPIPTLLPPVGETLPPYSVWMNWDGTATFSVN